MSTGLRLIAGGWLAFIAENLILSEYRTKIIDRWDAPTYHAIYNSCSLVACGSIAYGFLRYGYRKGPIIRSLDHFVHSKLGQGLKFSLRFAGIGLLSQTLPPLQIPFYLSHGGTLTNERTTSSENTDTTDKFLWKARCPIDFGSTASQSITRHPSLWAFGLTSLSFALSPYKTHLFMFGFPFIFTIIGTAHIDSRHKRGIGGHLDDEKIRTSSYFPLGRYIDGSIPWSHLKENLKELNLTIAFIISLVIP